MILKVIITYSQNYTQSFSTDFTAINKDRGL